MPIFNFTLPDSKKKQERDFAAKQRLIDAEAKANATSAISVGDAADLRRHKALVEGRSFEDSQRLAEEDRQRQALQRLTPDVDSNAPELSRSTWANRQLDELKMNVGLAKAAEAGETFDASRARRPNSALAATTAQDAAMDQARARSSNAKLQMEQNAGSMRFANPAAEEAEKAKLWQSKVLADRASGMAPHAKLVGDTSALADIADATSRRVGSNFQARRLALGDPNLAASSDEAMDKLRIAQSKSLIEDNRRLGAPNQPFKAMELIMIDQQIKQNPNYLLLMEAQQPGYIQRYKAAKALMGIQAPGTSGLPGLSPLPGGLQSLGRLD